MNDDKKVQAAKAEAEGLIEDLFGLATRIAGSRQSLP